MRKPFIAVGACVVLGGCALPVPLQVASWALDVVSVVATEKSLTDHGISVLAQKDCALHRVVTDADNIICREHDDSSGAVLVTEAEGTQTSGEAVPASAFAEPTVQGIEAGIAALSDQEASAAADSGADLAGFETAAASGRQINADRPERPVAVLIDIAALQPEIEAEQRPFVTFSVDVTSQTEPNQAARPALANAGNAAFDAKPRAGFYYVIGSFRAAERAKRHMTSFSVLQPAVLKGKIGRSGREVFRVVVGPFAPAERKVAYRRIKRSGINDTWAIRVAPADWSVAARVESVQQAYAGVALDARDWPGLTALATKAHGR